jgi:fumarate reductase flavoprotein subunit
MKKSTAITGALIAAAVLVIAACATTGGAASGASGATTTASGPSGTATAVAQGFGGEVTVTVTLENGVITEVTAEGPGETPGIGSEAIAQLPNAIKAANSADVDGISGATFSSNAVITAAKDAIAQIGK